MPNDLMTLEQYMALPADERFIDEVSRGQLVREPRPGFEHGFLVARLCTLFARYLERQPIAQIIAEAGFVLASTPLAIRGPDVAIVRNERLHDERVAGFLRGAPDIAIEVVSPSNRPGELLTKVAEFLEAGTQAVWVVYPRTRTVIVHDAGGDVSFYDADSVVIAAILPGFELAVREIFAD